MRRPALSVSSVPWPLKMLKAVAREYRLANSATFSITVTVVGLAFSVQVEYRKFVTDAFGRSSLATTWSRGTTGTHGHSASYIQSSVSSITDEFLATYLRVNEEACER